MLEIVDHNQDVLLAILARTCASDHNNLRATCRTFSSMLDSSAFRKERALLELAETETRLWTKEQYVEECKGDYDEVDWEERKEEIKGAINELGVPDVDYDTSLKSFHAVIWVDGKKEGKIEGRIIKRPSLFHELCDSVSDDMRRVGWTFCDRIGKVRLEEVKLAIKTHAVVPGDDYQEPDSGEHSAANFVYIEKFHLEREEHRRFGTKIAADALRSLFGNTALRYNWTLAVYIPDSRSFLTDQDKRPVQDPHAFLHPDKTTEEDLAADQRWDARIDECARTDMQLFLRAGFHQARELRADSGCYHVYAIPAFFASQMISHQEALALPITEKPKYPHKPIGKNAELLELFVNECSKRKTTTSCTIEMELSATEMEEAQFEEQIQHIDIDSKVEEKMRGTLEGLISEGLIDLSLDEVVDNPKFDGMRQYIRVKVCDIIEEERATIHQKLLNLRMEAQDGGRIRFQNMENELKQKAQKLIAAGADIGKSHILHCVASNQLPTYLDVVLGLVPKSESSAEESRLALLNAFDSGGRTPLMTVAGQFNLSPESQYDTCQKLIALGADPYLENLAGHSAWKCYRDAIQGSKDFGNMIGDVVREQQRENIRARSRLRELLMPPGNDDSDGDDDEDPDEDLDFDFR
jgi:hypothetical protein